MWLSADATMASPGEVCVATATRLHIVPVGRKRPASCPSISATRSHSRLTVGSVRCCSSPTSAVAMARRMASVGFVCVSL